METGVLPPRGKENAAFVAYCARPTEVAPLIQETGLEVIALLGVEGLVSMIEEAVNGLSGQAWETWVDLNYKVAADPSVHGCVEHLLAVAIKPRWRAVLKRVARRMNEARVPFKVVGGTVPVLHGIRVPVHDIDLEMDARDAYRFQDLFAAYVTQPVTLCESETYRSHFGRFDIDGIVVEVMGDLYRREGSSWMPTSASTEVTVDVEGVPVRVPWLEEETLASIRRGRMERAARCLPFCDHERLMHLLRGETATNVL
jgi:hypothetical protein